MRDLKCILVLWLTPFVFVIPPWPTAYITYKLYHRVLKVDSICVYLCVCLCVHTYAHTHECVSSEGLYFSLLIPFVYLFLSF